MKQTDGYRFFGSPSLCRFSCQIPRFFRCAERAGAFVPPHIKGISSLLESSGPLRCRAERRVVRWRWGLGLGLGVGWWLQPCFLSLTKHRRLCERKTSLTPRNHDLVLEGRLLQSRPTTAAMADALITRSFEKKVLKAVLETRHCCRRLGVNSLNSLTGMEDVEGDGTNPHKLLGLCVCWILLVVLPNRPSHVQ